MQFYVASAKALGNLLCFYRAECSLLGECCAVRTYVFKSSLVVFISTGQRLQLINNSRGGHASQQTVGVQNYHIYGYVYIIFQDYSTYQTLALA